MMIMIRLNGPEFIEFTLDLNHETHAQRAARF
jgi:hypothetical protein